jgi:hypothetical protein
MIRIACEAALKEPGFPACETTIRFEGARLQPCRSSPAKNEGA